MRCPGRPECKWRALSRVEWEFQMWLDPEDSRDYFSFVCTDPITVRKLVKNSLIVGLEPIITQDKFWRGVRGRIPARAITFRKKMRPNTSGNLGNLRKKKEENRTGG